MYKIDQSRSTLLFARPSWLEGFARLLDISGSLNSYNSAPTPEMADFYATQSDWFAVGDDLRSAISETKRNLSLNR